METISRFILAAIFFIFSVSDSLSQMSADVYKRADDLAKVTADKVYYGNVRPVWIGKTNSFIYENLTPEGTEFMIVDSEKLTKRKAFNQERFAESLGKEAGKKFDPGKLPIRNLVFSDKLSSFAFTYDGYNWICNLRDYTISKREKVPGRPVRSSWDWGFRDELTTDSVKSPDLKWIAFIRNYNVFVRAVDDKDKKDYQLSYDGALGEYYSSYIRWSASGVSKVIIGELSPTFIDYSGKRYRYDAEESGEIIWASERDGWNHLYLYDSGTGEVKNQITSGSWMVRDVTRVDEKNRQIIFQASGREAGDPYFIYYYRVNFDGTGLKLLSEGEGTHDAGFSPDHRYFVDTWSTISAPPVSVLRRADDGTQLMAVEKADITRLLETGIRLPEVFTAKGRDGVTDIWGIIIRPTDFDPSTKYPVIEDIYAGPHGSFVPKSFRGPATSMHQLAELGFIVVKIDGMGTSNRSKAFHDVCWKNIKDAGFPDRILWMKAAAEKYPYMDIDRVGVYGTSAGGQNAAGAVLFHPDFYKVAVASCGCHDNRMDKMWWNEQWMGWPVGVEYAESSNVENAGKLKGKLLLLNGEMDYNVDPSSTAQLVNALIRAGKDFEYVLLPGAGHTSGGVYGERRRRDFFVKNLLGLDPPDWNMFE
ncbi:MAG: prolyl oligopeptidase family serine peptidase [Bacteroidales bacterium]